MTIHDLLRELEKAGAVLTVEDGMLSYEIPEPATHLIPELHRLRHEVAQIRQQHLAVHVMGFRREQCVACAMGSSNPVILHREFLRWSGYRCTIGELVAALASLGFGLDSDGMIDGLILREDFAAALEYERRARVADAEE